MPKKSITRPLSTKGSAYPARGRHPSKTGAESDTAEHARVFPGNGHSGEHGGYGEQLLTALLAVKKGDFNVRLPVGWTGIGGKVADTFNDVAELMARSTDELSRVSRVVGKEGRIQERLAIGHVTGHWAERVNSVNTLIECLAHPIQET